MTLSSLKRKLIGEPFPTRADVDERLDKKRGLAVFASDPISSNAYATEAIMSVLILMGSAALALTLPLGIGIALLVLFVIFSYIQTILHYPDGGGAYTVAKDNLGTMPSLFAASALLLDYILTVSVSVSAGIRAITSAVPATLEYRLIMALLAIAILTWVNLRGVRESGTIFSIPTYAFVAGVLLVIGIGMTRYLGLFGAAPLAPEVHDVAAARPLTSFLTIWLILRAFAAGCTALTGIEAISNGVKAFKIPESINAAKTMVVMGVIAMSLFLGITFLATQLNLLPTEEESILSQMTRSITGGGPVYYWVQFFTMMILILAANTGYQDFPRLSSYLARDGFMPRWMQNRGDRLVYNGGIIVLAALSSILVIAFDADEIAMLPLYALGVMLSFTISQYGMSRLMAKVGRLKPGGSAFTGVTTIHYEPGWHWKRLVNLVGSIVTGIVLLVLIVTKFVEGAWVIVIAIPLVVYLLHSIQQHYVGIRQALSTQDLTLDMLHEIADVVIVPMADIHRGTLRALRYAKRISRDVRAVYIATDDAQKERFMVRWQRFPEMTDNATLQCIEYEYRDILTPLVNYIDQVSHKEFPDRLITVVIPEFVPESFTGHLLHNQTANILRVRLRTLQNVVVIDVPFHVPG
ncbi:MAG TPA: APC family permease [Chloroflexota bacterium]|nr:APC family permease [Chloroflexota bacterium]